MIFRYPPKFHDERYWNIKIHNSDLGEFLRYVFFLFIVFLIEITFYQITKINYQCILKICTVYIFGIKDFRIKKLFKKCFNILWQLFWKLYCFFFVK